MLRIAICDDDISICTELEVMINTYADTMNEKFKVGIYYSGKKLCEDISEGKCFDLVMLDIEMQNMDGIAVGNYIRNQKKNYDMDIVYISSHTSYALQLFQFRPFDFLVKPLKQETVNRMMNKFLEMTGRKYSVFRHGSGKNEVEAYIKDILYFAISGRVIKIITTCGELFFYGKLKDVASDLESHKFFYANKSQLVNYQKVDKFYRDKLIMENGEIISISQGRQKEIAEIHRKCMEMKRKE